MSVITISREFGSEGDAIAQKVAQALGYHFCGSKIHRYRTWSVRVCGIRYGVHRLYPPFGRDLTHSVKSSAT